MVPVAVKGRRASYSEQAVDPPQPWDLAHLADAHTEQARHQRTEALTLLTDFPDPHATALRQRLQELTTG
ncbi:hypothetical protein [Streptomyces melanosporofaciens]|uniref:hypothetical protein n=1 Tax=Streptomyces melanosporofaciens TaxID=67327 RepID=UPI001FCC1166|nr:hypothetical protein [Streptomyces melanosporofaciens]